MKRTMFLMLSAALMVGMVGCVSHHGRWRGVCADGTCIDVPEGSAQAGDCVGPNGECCPTDGTACDDGACGGLWGKLCKSCKGKKAKRPPLPPQEFNAGPPDAQVAYPYYTIRGPRDYLARNPSSIGP
jgi:hypothetical protein